MLELDPDTLLTTTRAVRKRLDFDRKVPRRRFTATNATRRTRSNVGTGALQRRGPMMTPWASTGSGKTIAVIPAASRPFTPAPRRLTGGVRVSDLNTHKGG